MYSDPRGSLLARLKDLAIGHSSNMSTSERQIFHHSRSQRVSCCVPLSSTAVARLISPKIGLAFAGKGSVPKRTRRDGKFRRARVWDSQSGKRDIRIVIRREPPMAPLPRNSGVRMIQLRVVLLHNPSQMCRRWPCKGTGTFLIRTVGLHRIHGPSQAQAPEPRHPRAVNSIQMTLNSGPAASSRAPLIS